MPEVISQICGASPQTSAINLKECCGLSQFKKGAAALGTLTTEASSGSSSEFAKFKSGTTLKVRVKSAEDIMQYFGYSVYKRVNTFVAKNPSERNERGYVTGNPTPWDKAAEYYYAKAKAAEEAGASEDEVKKIRNEGYKFSGKERYAIGFHELESGEDIVIDFTRDQAKAVHATITKYAKKLDKIAFELTKTGASTDTKVALMPIIDMDEDLTEKERANFDKSIGQPFNDKLFDGLLFEADEKQQTENLVAAGFDITLIGLSIGANSTQTNEEVTPVSDEITEEELPF